MRLITNKYGIFNKLLYVSAFALLLCGCGKFDNLDADDFNFFDDEEKKDMAELRKYTEPGMSNTPIIEYIVDESNKTSISNEQHIRKVCDYTKMPYKSVDVKSWNAVSSSARVICIMETKKLSQAAINKIIEFVAGGGTLVLLTAAEDTRISFLTGLRPDAEYETDITSKGYLFKVPMLPNMKNQTYLETVTNFGYTQQNFTKNIRVLATAANNPLYPVIVENPIGKGKVIYYNTSVSFEKLDRGLVFSGLLKGLEGVPYPIANTATIFLDDFPSPLYNIKSEPIKSELDMTVTDFVKKVWWPDMITLSKKYNISYSAMIAFDYKNKVLPPFIFDQWEENKIRSNKKIEPISDWLVKDVKNRGHELAFHGYNHVSLKKDLWKNQEFIGTSLKAVEKKWEISNFGALPTSYVPPSNIIDKEGIQLLKEGMPSLKYMCSLYLGDKIDGGGREFDFDPYHKDFFDYPRISDGFYLSNEKKFSQQSLYLYTGIWTHFIHPDDVYQVANPFNKSQGDYDLRNDRGLGWRKTKGKDGGMYSEFDGYLKQMTTLFPQMRFLNANDGGAIVNDWRASKFSHTSGDGLYTVEELNPDQSTTDKQYWFVYASLENAAKIEGQLKNESVIYSKTPYMNGHLYMVYTNKPKLTLRDIAYKSPAENTIIKKITKKVQDDHKKYLASVKKFITGGNEVWVDDSDKKFQLELKALKNKMETDTKIDSVTWNKYAKYMVWEDRGAEVWKMLEDYCVKHPEASNVMYSKELNKIVEYPNELTREKWMSAQLLVTPNDKDLLNSYVASFYTPENQEKIRNALISLLKVDTSFETYLQYIQHLLTYDPPAALVELADKKPTEEFRPVAADVAWLYANEAQYQKAYEWSLLSDEIDFASKMSWLIELKSYKLLETEYKKHIVKNPEDYQSKATMSSVYHETGKFRDAWILANSLPESPEKTALKEMLNKDVLYVEEELQQDLVENHVELFLPEVLAELTKTYRKERGNFLQFNSSAESNKNKPAAFINVLSYNFYDKKNNLHSIAATYSTMYKIETNIKDKDNVTHAIGGVQYQFNNPKREEKLQYWGRGRVEYSDYQRFYYQFGIGANISKPRNFKSAEFRIAPTETGPAHSKRIYRFQLNLYQDIYFMKYFNASVSLEGNFYLKSKPNTNVKTGDTYEGSITTKLILDDGVEKKSKFLPFIEGSRTQASLGRSTVPPATGYPYWIIDERLYGGGGIGWKYGLSDGNLITRVEAAHFFDDYSKEFQRYVGEVAYQIFDYTLITASFEIYTQSKFYSNVIQFGVKYNLKKRKKK